MDMFQAIADPTRRHILELLATRGTLSASAISDKFSMSAPAISQHLKILRESKLVDMEKKAQQRIYTINTKSIQEVEQWIHTMTKLWNDRFDRLDIVIQKEKLKGGVK
jgi:DNA-binding transcriptional ArsR family regulator